MSGDLQMLQSGMKEKLRHPCDSAAQRQQQETASMMNQLRTTHGWAAAAISSLDQRMLLRTRRLGGLPSSNVLFNHYTGNNGAIEVTDIYGLPSNDPRVRPAPRAIIEKEVYGEELVFKTIKPRIMS